MNSKKVLKQLGAQKRIYKMAKASFEKHAKNCRHQYTGADGERKCSHPKGNQSCRFSVCPLIQGEEEKR